MSWIITQHSLLSKRTDIISTEFVIIVLWNSLETVDGDKNIYWIHIAVLYIFMYTNYSIQTQCHWHWKLTNLRCAKLLSWIIESDNYAVYMNNLAGASYWWQKIRTIRCLKTILVHYAFISTDSDQHDGCRWPLWYTETNWNQGNNE